MYIYIYVNMPEHIPKCLKCYIFKFTLKAMCKYCGRVLGWKSNPHSIFLLITSIYFNFLIWMYPFFKVLAIIYCDADMKVTTSCLKNWYFCTLQLKRLKHISDTVLARSWWKWATPDPMWVTKLYHTVTDMQLADVFFSNNDLSACWLVKLSHNAQFIQATTMYWL